ncbi:hypothetical protein PTTG_04808 [Puccinia triticina 1-1 BBBD Race 1]|uniref:Post-SET domain-containing protein n=2 Tax=Puccinia triticina TaxID=208348 RepID=A0A180GT13_PUCT1|nr:uncharacterized protein PtA15_14A135 [Puccinia triticina]OAV95674.1 hypothetical protein PTTG_04808 [Puccinia triticina 1-1 BBBD Race 1]WAQ91253.1 hypothetical protein PtA15_14A135 [Puccinia triticina]WAR62056.1 hypothetical protein PtB15_14B150 [Puccinia triticina]
MAIELKKLRFPDQFEIFHGPEGCFDSKLISLQDFPAGQVLATLGQECKVSQTKAYTSVQFDDDAVAPKKAHFELNSELVYINHSCEPNVAFDLPGGWKGLEEGRWCLRSLSEIKKGEALTFAYFSTEWHMAQPFQCKCGSRNCLGMIQGAKHLDKETLDRYFINEHIRQMKQTAQ